MCLPPFFPCIKIIDPPTIYASPPPLQNNDWSLTDRISIPTNNSNISPYRALPLLVVKIVNYVSDAAVFHIYFHLLTGQH